MSIGKRETALQALDMFIFRFATRKWAGFGPSIAYQPSPWRGLTEGRRAKGSERRKDEILSYLDAQSISPAVTLDVGANIGYFSLSMAEKGAIAYAVESEPLNVRIASIASNSIGQGGGVFVPIRMLCTADSVGRLPENNVTLCLSIWHHWVRHFGLKAATEILNVLMNKTSDVLFFDTGESEMPAHYGLPFDKHDAKEWLLNYLSNLESAADVKCIGKFEAFMPNSDENADNVERHLFAIKSCKR
jgi:hypothetical protein